MPALDLLEVWSDLGRREGKPRRLGERHLHGCESLKVGNIDVLETLDGSVVQAEVVADEDDEVW